MRIAVDLDGVMADWTQGWVRAYNAEFGTQLLTSYVKAWNDNLNLTHFEDQGTFFEWLKTIPHFWANLMSYPGAARAVFALKGAGHTVDFVTHRPDWAKDATRHWLDARNLLDGSELIFEADKGTTGHDVYVDDAPHVLAKLEEAGISCIRLYRPWNEDGAGIVAFDWNDVLDSIGILERIAAVSPASIFDILGEQEPGADGYVTFELHTERTPQTGEVRVVDPKTGGAKGQKLARFDLLPPDALTAVATHFGLGARKYADRNWEKGYAWGLSYGAAMRHLNLFWSGEDNDDDPSLGQPSPHLAAAAFHILALLAFQARSIGTDDRGA